MSKRKTAWVYFNGPTEALRIEGHPYLWTRDGEPPRNTPTEGMTVGNPIEVPRELLEWMQLPQNERQFWVHEGEAPVSDFVPPPDGPEPEPEPQPAEPAPAETTEGGA